MFSYASIIFILGYLSRVSTQLFCTEDACYARWSTDKRNWRDAYILCKKYGSTLPIVSDPIQQRNFETACRNLTSSRDLNEGIWIGARAFSNDWMWLDGSKYNGTDIQSRGEYYPSYSYVINTAFGLRAFAAPPTDRYSYICYYPFQAAECISGTGQTAFQIESRFYVKYNERMSWFAARNNCLKNGGDLASFTQLSLLDGKIDSNGAWVGLRNSQLKWQSAVTGLSYNVTYTSWSHREPNDTVPSCISTDLGVEFPGWRDYNCSQHLAFICQVNRTTSTYLPCSLTSALTSRDRNIPTNPSSSTTTPTTTSSSTTTPTTPSSTTTPTTLSSSTTTPTTPSSTTPTTPSSTTTPTTLSCSTTTPTTPSSSTRPITPTTLSSSTTTPTTLSSSTTTPTTTSSSTSTTNPTTLSSSTTTLTTPSSSTTTSSTPSSSTTTPTNPIYSTTEKNTSNTHPAENISHETRSVHIALAVGLGVGIGVPVIILIVAVIIVIIVWRKRQSSFPGGNFQSTNSLNNSKPETSEMNEMENGTTVSYSDSSAEYTTVRPPMDVDARLPSKQGIVYEPLSFN